MINSYDTKEQVLMQANTILHKTLREVVPIDELKNLISKIQSYGTNRKGFLGELIEFYIFGKTPNGISEADFSLAGVELKTSPLKTHSEKEFISKERLVFSMIDYDKVVNEKWESSSFLHKNKLVLLMFYLWIKDQSIIDYEFKFIYLLNLFESISSEDIFQIQKDWEYIVEKIKRGEAHLLSEADTYYLGACTKAKNSFVVRDQPMNHVPAKPRAFSLKQQYLNYLIQKNLLHKNVDTTSIFNKRRRIETIENMMNETFKSFIGKTDNQIIISLGIVLSKKSKAYKRYLTNKMLGTDSGKVEELMKANVTLKVITLESTGSLTESVSFPAFDYKDLINQSWYDEKNETMADFHEQLETKKFLFIIFQKIKNSDEIYLKKIKFWNFPAIDLVEAERIWQKTVKCINEGKYTDLPKLKDRNIVHIRPHALNALDTIETPQGTQEIKRSFWLNAKYIQKAIEKE